MLEEPELREMVETCARESDRLARVLRSLAHLLDSQLVSPKLEAVDLQEVVEAEVSAGDGVDSGVRSVAVVSRIDTALPEVMADREATTELLHSLMEAMQACSGPKDGIQICCEKKKDAVQLSLLNENLVSRGVPGELRVALMLATARMHLQHGTVSWRTSPMVVELTFRGVEHLQNERAR
jgi:light-regulated signal transduction histidine kinase (bacteriophytochrome)